ncbi:MAG: SdrD B-like domain-containing protein [Cyanobacteria bacterium J06621_11]
MKGTGVNDLGFKISAKGDISAYFSNRSFQTTDLTVILEKESLGQAYALASIGYRNRDGGQFSVQATENNTKVEVTLPDGQSFSRTINLGQTFKFATGVDNSNLDISIPANFDLTGTIVETSAPTAVFSGHFCANVGEGFCDHLVEQMPPIEALSSSYVVGSAFSENGTGNNLIRIIAPKGGTQVKVDGQVVTTLGAQEQYEFVLSESAAVIETTKPSLVAQYLQGRTTAGEGDPAMMFVPGQDAWLSEYRLATPAGSASFEQNLVNIVIPTAALGSLMLEGKQISANEFTQVQGTPFSVGNIVVPQGIFSLKADQDFQVSLFGYEDFDSYLTFGAAAFATGVSPTATLTGFVWNDVDKDGIFDQGNNRESGLSDVTVYLDENGNNRFDDGEQFQTTAENGSYTFDKLSDGTYTVREVVPTGFKSTSPQSGEYRLTLEQGDVVKDISFGSVKIEINNSPRLTLKGTEARDRINGQGGDDNINALGGNDIVDGRGGNDFILGKGGKDQLSGGSGNDRIFGGDGNDRIIGGEGNDLLKGETNDDVLIGNAGDDKLIGGSGVNRLIGGDGNDSLTGGDEKDILLGGNGNDRMLGGKGNDIMIGGGDDDSLLGNAGNDSLTGEAGNDRLMGGDGNDSIIGGNGDDFAIGGEGNDVISGGNGNDVLVGSNGRDRLTARNGDDRLVGGNGNDSLSGGNGADTLVGGDRNDILSGGNGNDRLMGGNDNDQLNGGVGDDILIGGNGQDRLAGEQGNDILVGGNNSDIFILSANAGTDTIQDFQINSDRIGLSGLSFGALTLKNDKNNLLIQLNNNTLAVVRGVSELEANDFVTV